VLEKATTFLAFLGAVFVYTVAQLVLPDTTAGRIAAFLIYGAALWPLAQRLWRVSAWRWAVGLAIGALIVWPLDRWRRGISPEVNETIGFIVFTLATVGILAGAWRALRVHGPRSR
jgi:hypothetical protein